MLANHERAFPREYCGELPALLEKQMSSREADDGKRAKTVRQQTMAVLPVVARDDSTPDALSAATSSPDASFLASEAARKAAHAAASTDAADPEAIAAAAREIQRAHRAQSSRKLVKAKAAGLDYV